MGRTSREPTAPNVVDMPRPGRAKPPEQWETWRTLEAPVEEKKHQELADGRTDTRQSVTVSNADNASDPTIAAMKGESFRGGSYTVQASPELRALVVRQRGEDRPSARVPANGANEHTMPREAPSLDKEFRNQTGQTETNAAEIDWPDRTDKGAIKQRSQENIRYYLEHSGITLRLNKFAHKVFIDRDSTTGEWTDDTSRGLWLEADQLGLQCSESFFYSVSLNEARKNGFHPVRDWLKGLKWDGKRRLKKWLITYAGVEKTDLNQAYGELTLIAAVARVMQPGCKKDEILVLEGPQGAGKSTLIRTLAGDDWFTDSLQIGSDPKEVIEQTAGKWLVEFAELAGMGKRESDAVKAMTSRNYDLARLAYARTAVDVPRQFILLGTVNPNTYLRDPTGNRRFWCVKVGSIKLKSLENDREQLWAEAVHMYEQDVSLLLPRTLWEASRVEQERRTLSDPWSDKIEKALYWDGEAIPECIVPVDSTWSLLGIEPNRQDSYQANRITQIMEGLGFHKERWRHESERHQVYANVTANDPAIWWKDLSLRFIKRSGAEG